MIININQVITNLLNEDRSIKNTRVSETYLLTPEVGKAIRNIRTQETFASTISIGSKSKISDFDEIDLDLK